MNRTRWGGGLWALLALVVACSDGSGGGEDPVETSGDGDLPALGGAPSQPQDTDRGSGGKTDDDSSSGGESSNGGDGSGGETSSGGESSNGGDGSGGETSSSGGASSGGASSGGASSGGASSGGASSGGASSGGAGSGGDSGGPTCCGCLCEDALWSCAEDTCINEEGESFGLGPEAGFLEIEGGDYVADGYPRTSPNHRIFYTFHPSGLGDDAPLGLFFNGGPGSSTSTLMGLNTAPMTLDPFVTGEETHVDNPHSWTQAMHTLHIDAPGTGFSYPLPLEDGRTPSVGIDIDRDAAIVVRFLLGFLERHPELLCNRVVLVGESYGGTRATLMLQHLLFPERLSDDSWIYVDPELADLIAAHEARTAACNGDAPLVTTSQFDTQVLIQPVVMGRVQWDRNSFDTSVCLPSNYDSYQCDQPAGAMDSMWNELAERLTTTAVLDAYLEVDPTTIDWFYPDQRVFTYGRNATNALPDGDMTEVFGMLPSTDVYHIDYNQTVGTRYESSARWWTDSRLADQFLDNLRTVKTLITHAPYDMVVDSKAILFGVASMTQRVSQIAYVDDGSGGSPDWLHVTYLDEHEVYFRMPTYEAAGHAVTLFESEQLLSDTIAFLEDPTPTPPMLASQILFPSLLPTAHKGDPARAPVLTPGQRGELGP